MLQASTKSFSLHIQNHQIIIALKKTQLTLTLIDHTQELLYQQKYDQSNIPSASAKTYATCAELYDQLQRCKDAPKRWLLQNQTLTVTFEESNILTLTLSKLQAVGLFLCLRQTQELKQQMAVMYSEMQTSKKEEEERRKQIGEQVVGMNQTLQQLCKDVEKNRQYIFSLQQNTETIRKELEQLITSQHLRIEQLEQLTNNQFAAIDQSLKQIKFEADVNVKNQNRNLATVKEELSLLCQTNKIDIKNLTEYVMKASLQKIKNDYLTIMNAFQTQIRIKDYTFKPDSRSLQQNKKVYFLNKKSLKCVEDTKDYFKIAGSTLFPFGRYQCRFTVKNIKNNGLLLGVCNLKAKNQLENIAFNDKNIVAINSCGYVVNRGAMHPFHWKIRSGDNLTMVVSTSTGNIKWLCNDIEIGYADLGGLEREQLYPVIGLGNFCDQIELIEQRMDIHVEQTNSTYKNQLAKLNQRFGNRSRAYDHV